MMELAKERLMALSNRENVGAICGDEIVAMARQLLAGMEQEPVAYIGKTMLEDIAGGERHCGRVWAGNEDRLSGESRIPLYAAPQLPQPAAVSNASREDFEAWARGAGFNENWYFFTNTHPNHYDDDHINDMWAAWNACRAAMLQGAEPVHDVDNTNRQFESLGCAEDTSRRFKYTGLIVTSDEQKMLLAAVPQQQECKHEFVYGWHSYGRKSGYQCRFCGKLQETN